ncbi:MAG: LysR family transcriptional regulator [Alphaproteobacteria bacterium]|nr:LysR family transcriptional regulator [Alphaproteobacteria bacterium]
MTVEQFISRLTLRHLRAVVAVADAGSLLGAARTLNLTQPTISKTLKEAEIVAGQDLFARTNRGVMATPFGEALVHHARLIVTQLRHAYEELSDLGDGTGGRVVVGTLITATARLLPDAIARLHGERPRLLVTIVDGTNDVLMPQLRSGEIDCVVGRLPEYREREGLVQEVLYHDQAYIVVRADHKLARRRKLSLGELANERWILPRPETTLRRQIDKDFRDAGVEAPLSMIDSVSPFANRRLLLSGDYVCIWPYEIARDEELAGRLTILPVALPSTFGPIGITTRRGGRLSPAAEALIASLRTTARTGAYARHGRRRR